jgi:hypothetical protein
MRLFAFIIALLLLGGAIDPTRGWLITLVVVTGISAFRLRPWYGFVPRPALDVRMGSFVLAVLLLAGSIDASEEWLIVLSVVTGVAAFLPRLIALDGSGGDDGWHRKHWRARRHDRRWVMDWEGDDWR